ncbi:MAG: hypothetical protein GX957_01140 [Clostridiaceae bacterium]|nr:hypothetical protein [Clostridiaceae bacterium]
MTITGNTINGGYHGIEAQYCKGKVTINNNSISNASGQNLRFYYGGSNEKINFYTHGNGTIDIETVGQQYVFSAVPYEGNVFMGYYQENALINLVTTADTLTIPINQSTNIYRHPLFRLVLPNIDCNFTEGFEGVTTNISYPTTDTTVTLSNGLDWTIANVRTSLTDNDPVVSGQRSLRFRANVNTDAYIYTNFKVENVKRIEFYHRYLTANSAPKVSVQKKSSTDADWVTVLAPKSSSPSTNGYIKEVVEINSQEKAQYRFLVTSTASNNQVILIDDIAFVVDDNVEFTLYPINVAYIDGNGNSRRQYSVADER